MKLSGFDQFLKEISTDDRYLYDGIGLLDYVPVPHYKSDHPESELVDHVIDYMNKNNTE